MFLNANKFLSLTCIFLPILMITGPAIPDIIISLCGLFFILNIIIENKYEYLRDKIFFLFVLFWGSLVFSSLISDYLILSISSSIFYIRFIFFILFIKYYASKFLFVQKYYLLILTFTIIFVSLDSLIQSYYGVEVFGNQKSESNQYRLDGPFGGREWIVGSFISTYFAICIAYLYSLKIDNIKNKNFIIIVSFLLFYFVTFISGERMAFIMMNFIIFIFLLTNKKYILNFIKALIIIFPIVLISFTLNNSFFDRFLSTFDVIGININVENDNNNFWDSHYGSHYLTTIEIFKNKPLIGAGPKSFREECKKEEYSTINSKLANIRCSTHPHNFYFQILSEVGLIGFALFLVFNLYILIYFFQYYKNNSFIFISIYLSILAFLWPIKSTGNILNNRYALFFYYLVMLMFIFIEKNKYMQRKN
jgi:O-antigen ligase